MINNEFHKIKDMSDQWYESFREVYTGSFPIHEQRNEAQQTEAFDDRHYNLILKTDEDRVISFIGYWDFKSYVYIEHLAVNPELRGQNKGSELLEDFAKFALKPVILEIDPPTDQISKKRLNFYERLDYKTNPYIHFHPAYREELVPHELIVLSRNKELTKGEYYDFYDDLCNIVMKNPNS